MRVLVALLAGIAAAAAQGTTEELVPMSSTWKYLDTGVEEAGWQGVVFDDSAWASGAGQFGYGDGDEATVVGFGPDESTKVVTTYFRKTFSIRNPAAVQQIDVGVIRDDGVVVYINGAEIGRDVMPDGPVTADTLASAGIGGADEARVVAMTAGADVLGSGDNVVAVEIHQNSPASSDMSFDLQLSVVVKDGESLTASPCDANPSSCSQVQLSQAPFLQVVGPTTVRVLFSTATATAAVGMVAPAGQTLSATTPSNTADAAVTDHIVEFKGLQPNTVYQYTLASAIATEVMTNADTNQFVTPPAAGHVVADRTDRVLLTNGNPLAASVAGWTTFRGSNAANAVIVMGDAYDGSAFVSGLLQPLAADVASTGLYTLAGNAEDPIATRSPAEFGTYFDTFVMPASGEAGGVPSGKEAYYSFNIGVTHVVVLDSFDVSDAQSSWLTADLAAAAATAQWIVAVSYHPPYSKSAVDSDVSPESTALRSTLVPLLESGGVDLMVSGLGSAYERSVLLDGHYGVSTTVQSTMVKSASLPFSKPAGATANNGAVYIVAGTANTVDQTAPLTYPVTAMGLRKHGVLALEVTSTSLTTRFLDSAGSTLDTVTINKPAPAAAAPSPSVAPQPTPSVSVTPTISVTPQPTPSNSPSSSVPPTPSTTPSPSEIIILDSRVCPEGGVCGCDALACCSVEQADVVHACRGNDNTVKGWEFTVAGVSVLAAVCGMGLYLYLKPRCGAGADRRNVPQFKHSAAKDAPAPPNAV